MLMYPSFFCDALMELVINSEEAVSECDTASLLAFMYAL